MELNQLNLNYKIPAQANKIAPILKKIFSKLKSNLTAESFAELEIKLEIAAREMLANAVEHGFSLAVAKNEDLEDFIIKIKVKIINNLLIIEVEDSGPGFDWENYDLETIPMFSEKGRGLKMIEELSDKMEFNSKGNIIKAYFQIN